MLPGKTIFCDGNRFVIVVILIKVVDNVIRFRIYLVILLVVRIKRIKLNI